MIASFLDFRSITLRFLYSSLLVPHPDDLVICGRVQSYLVSFRRIQRLLGGVVVRGRVRSFLVFSRYIQSCRVTSSRAWSSLVLYSLVQSCLVLFRRIQTCLIVFSSVWSSLVFSNRLFAAFSKQKQFKSRALKSVIFVGNQQLASCFKISGI